MPLAPRNLTLLNGFVHEVHQQNTENSLSTGIPQHQPNRYDLPINTGGTHLRVRHSRPKKPSKLTTRDQNHAKHLAWATRTDKPISIYVSIRTNQWQMNLKPLIRNSQSKVLQKCMPTFRCKSSRLERTCSLSMGEASWNFIRLWGNYVTPFFLIQSENAIVRPSKEQQRHPAPPPSGKV